MGMNYVYLAQLLQLDNFILVNYSLHPRKLTVVKTFFFSSSLNVYELPAFANNISVQRNFSCWLCSFSINFCPCVCVQDTNRCPAPPPPPAAVTAHPASTVCLWSWRASRPTTPPPSSATWHQSTDPSRRHWHREDDTIWQVIDGDFSQCEVKMTPSLNSAPRKHFSRLMVETSCKNCWLHVVTADGGLQCEWTVLKMKFKSMLVTLPWVRLVSEVTVVRQKSVKWQNFHEVENLGTNLKWLWDRYLSEVCLRTKCQTQWALQTVFKTNFNRKCLTNGLS